MTRTPPHPDGEQPGPGPDAVAGLAREVDTLRRAVEPLAPVPARVDALARLVAQLTDTLDTLTRRAKNAPVPSWMLAPADPAHAAETLRELCGWMSAVYLRYSDAASGLPECWFWHPDVVEELLWLMHAWSGAYQGAGASVQLVADWHDRQRPGVVRRIRGYAGSCSNEAHLIRSGWTRVASGAPTLPEDRDLDAAAAWWGTDRDRPAPEPPRPVGTADGMDHRGGDRW